MTQNHHKLNHLAPENGEEADLGAEIEIDEDGDQEIAIGPDLETDDDPEVDPGTDTEGDGEVARLVGIEVDMVETEETEAERDTGE